MLSGWSPKSLSRVPFSPKNIVLVYQKRRSIINWRIPFTFHQNSHLCAFFFHFLLPWYKKDLLCPLLIWATSECFHWIGSVLSLDQFKFKQKTPTSNSVPSIVWHYICTAIANSGNICHVDRQSTDHRTTCVCQTTAGAGSCHNSLEVHSD